MKQVITKILLGITLITMANEGNKFSDLSEEYLYGNISVNVRKVIAKDPKTITKILVKNSNSEVSKYASKNLH